MAEKKYYWLKMTDQFFKDKTIKKLRKIAGGDTYTIIYLKMLLTAIKQGNKMYFEGIEDDFMEELALELDEDTDNVSAINQKMAMDEEIIMLDQSPMFISSQSLNNKADYLREGQLTVTGKYGCLRNNEKKHNLVGVSMGFVR